MARGQSQVTLSDDGENTRLQYTVQASVCGKLGQVGGRMIDAAAKQMADQFFNAFQSQLGATPGGLPADSAAPSAPQAHALAGAAEGIPLVVDATAGMGLAIPENWDLLIAAGRDWGAPAGAAFVAVRPNVRWNPPLAPDRGWLGGFPNVPAAAAAVAAGCGACHTQTKTP